MASGTDKEMAVARVYALSMLELADEQDQAQTLLEELNDLVSLVDREASLKDFFTNPTVDAEARSQMIEKVFRGHSSHILVTSLQVINHKGRLSLLSAIVEQYRLAYESLCGRIEVIVKTAAPLTDDLREKIAAAANTMTQKESKLTEHVDPSVIGGLILQIGDLKFDLSVSTQLKKLRGALQDRASRELGQRARYVIQNGA